MKCKFLKVDVLSNFSGDIERIIESRIKDMEVVLVTQSTSPDGKFLYFCFWYE